MSTDANIWDELAQKRAQLNFLLAKGQSPCPDWGKSAKI